LKPQAKQAGDVSGVKGETQQGLPPRGNLFTWEEKIDGEGDQEQKAVPTNEKEKTEATQIV